MTKLLTVFVIIVGFISFAACNTIKGAGKDIERGGEHIQDASDSVQKKL